MKMWPTMSKIVTTLRLPEKERITIEEEKLVAQIRKARVMVYQRFLTNTNPVSVSTIEEPLANFLAAEGVLSPAPLPPLFKISSPAIHSLLMANMLPLLQHPRPTLPVPFTYDGESLEVIQIIKGCLPSFNKDLLKIARWRAFKTCRVPGYFNRKPVPQEDVYQTELYSTLRSWLPVEFKVIPHPNSGLILPEDSPGSLKRTEAARKTDIIVELSPTHRILFELVASAQTKELQEHFERAACDSLALNTREAWVINFTVVAEESSSEQETQSEQIYKYVFPEPTKNVKALHVWHNLDFTHAKLVYVDNGMKKQEEIML